MSADNGIYIGIFEDGIRVAHGFAIENVSYPSVTADRAKKSQADLWDTDNVHCLDEVFEEREKAVVAAHDFKDEILERYQVVEYGVRVIRFPHKYPEEYKE